MTSRRPQRLTRTPSLVPSVPPVLAVLFDALAAETRHARVPGPHGDGLVGFKTAGDLVSVLSVELGRLVTRRALVRYLSALRAWLHQASGPGVTLQTNRWLGWRVVSRAAAAVAGGRTPTAARSTRRHRSERRHDSNDRGRKRGASVETALVSSGQPVADRAGFVAMDQAEDGSGPAVSFPLSRGLGHAPLL